MAIFLSFFYQIFALKCKILANILFFIYQHCVDNQELDPFFQDRLTNNIIVNNSGHRGGGIHLDVDNPAILTNNTICNNHANYGGGIYHGRNADPVIKNSIIYGNSAVSGGAQIYISDVSSDPKIFNSDIQGGTAGFGGPGSGSSYSNLYLNNIDISPSFTSPSSGTGTGYNGYEADWTLQTNSACINTGTSDTTGLNIPWKDISGNPRINNGKIDIGALENQQNITVCGNITSDTVWAADTIKVTCNITINNEKTLTIMPGTYVEFQGFYNINVLGRLLALGTANEMITFSINDTTNFHNMSTTNGGWNGLRFNSTPTNNDSSKLINCIFQYGKSSVSGFHVGEGGAMYIFNSSKILISNCIFSNNRAYYQGGAIYMESSNIIVNNSLFTNNSAEGYIYNGNLFGYGGAIYMNDCDPLMTNNTISYNLSSHSAGGMYLTVSDPIMKNNIIYNNVSQRYGSNYNELYIYSSSSPNFYNCNIKGGKTSALGNHTVINNYINNISANPQFISSPSGAGALYDGLTAELNILSSSPCINGGMNLSGLHLQDLAGNNRRVGSTIDIGAYESQISSKFITAQPVSQVKCINDQANFAVSSSVPFDYQWYKNGAQISGATNTSLIIDSVQLADTGSYFCALSNNYGTINTNTVTLTVLIPPVFTSHPSHDTACAGDSASFTVTTTGSEPLTYQWYNNNGQVPGTYSTYNINSVNANNVSIYYSIVTNLCGSAQSNGANLVMNTMPVISPIPGNHTICENQSLTYSAYATGTTPISYQWYYNNSIIPNANTTTYNITSINTSDAGNYYAKATNICGVDSTNTSLLVVDSIPEITSQTSNTSRCVGQSMTFTITASGTAPVTYQWYLNSSIIAGATNNFYSVNSLSISDAGNYYCIATNSCGFDQCNNITLTVNEPPQINSHSQNSSVCESQSASFSITASGTAPITYQWYHNNSVITNATNNTFTNNSTVIADAGNYHCKVTNLCGNSQSGNAILTILTPPDVTTHSDSSTLCSAQNMILNVTATGALPISYQWHFNNFPIPGAANNFHLLSSIENIDAGNYHCIATNLCGTDQSININLVVNEPITILSQSGDSSRCEGESMIFSVDVSGTSPITYIWYYDTIAIPNSNFNSSTIPAVATTHGGTYKCMITNMCGTESSISKVLIVNANPVVNLGIDTTFCKGGSITLFAGSGYFCNWNNGSINPQLNVTETGDYSVNITDINGCNGISDTAHVNVIEPYPFEEVCVVTVFPPSGKNLIAWERTSGQGIIGYNIYKESVIGGQYQIIGTLPFDSLSIWEDNKSNPKQRADRYRITAIDTCGNESAPSQVHKTIHLTASKGTSGENNLIWNHYEGFPFDYYRIYRGTKPSNITIIDSIQSTLNDYSDLNPPGGVVFYQVTAAKNDTCYPAIVRGITSSGPYSQSLSNLKDYNNAPGNYLTIDPPEIVLDSNAGSGDTVGIYTNTPYWSAMTNESWLKLTPNLDEGTLIVTASSENTASEARTGLVVISSDGVDNQTIIVEQLGKWGKGSGITELTQNGRLRIYPNPFSKSTYIILPEIESDISKLDVFDISGKLVRSVENIKGNRYELFKDDLAEGLYFIKVIADMIYFDKVVVE